MDRTKSEFSSSSAEEEEVPNDEFTHNDPFRTPPNKKFKIPKKHQRHKDKSSGIMFEPFGSPESPYEIAISGLKPRIWGRSPYQLRNSSSTQESRKILTPVKCLTYDSPIKVTQENSLKIRSNTISGVASILLKENEEVFNLGCVSPLEECTNRNRGGTQQTKRKRLSNTSDIDEAHMLLTKATKKLKISDDKPPLQRCYTLGVCRRVIPGLAIPDFSSFTEDITDEELPDEIRVAADLVDFCHFPVIKNYKNELFTIKNSVLSDAIINHNSEKHSNYKIVVIDCRFPYEYEGGHIIGAQNLYTEDHAYKYFFDNSASLLFDQQGRIPIFVFHCEFSSKRGPKLASYIRDIDRAIHMDCYPKLFYPEIYVLKGGYREFYSMYQYLCEPAGYIEMLDKRFTEKRLQLMKLIKNPKLSNINKDTIDLDDDRKRIL